MLYDVNITAEQLKAASQWAEAGVNVATVQLLADDRMLIVTQGDERTAFDTGGEVGSDQRTLSADALYETARALADRGDDYGWNVYHLGSKIDPAEEKKLAEMDPNFSNWAEAFNASLVAYHDATGEDWRY